MEGLEEHPGSGEVSLRTLEDEGPILKSQLQLQSEYVQQENS